MGRLVESYIDVTTVIEQMLHQELPILMRIFEQKYGVIEGHMHALDGKM